MRAAPPARVATGVWSRPARRPASIISANSFRFLNLDGSLADLGWSGPGRDALWRYNQHYFDDLNAEGAEARKEWHLALLCDWVKQNTPGESPGWEPYPTSLRIVNWVKWSLNGNTLPECCIESLAIQARWLTKRLERHLLGNHLLSNGKALIFAGLFFDGKEAQKWMGTGVAILRSEITEQILADGGHFERSTMYHALALEDMMDLYNIAQAHPKALEFMRQPLVREWEHKIGGMRRWLAAMCHPDGEIALFNDAAFGIAPNKDELERYAADLGLSPIEVPPAKTAHLRHSGYIRVVKENIVVLLDVAPVAVDYLPGHAHADTLSFELSIFGRRVVVNGGTSRYGLGPERLRERQTAAHSTVEIAGESSSEVWGGFRVARRAVPFGLNVCEGGDITTVVCSHTGYRRLPGKPIHTRKWRVSPSSLDVADSVTGGSLPAVARYIFHPQVKAQWINGESLQLTLPSGEVTRVTVQEGRPALAAATYAPEFGTVIPTSVLEVDLVDNSARVTFSISPS